MACNLKVISLNVRGIRNQNKRRANFCYLKQQKATIFCLQETYSQPDDEKIWSAEWRGEIFFCRGTVQSKAVCILLNPNSTFNFDVIQRDHQGRILISKLKICEEIFFIVQSLPRYCSNTLEWKNCFSWYTSRNWYALGPRKTQATFAHHLGQTIYLFLKTSSERIVFGWTCKQTNYSMEIRKMYLDVILLT